MRLKKSKIIWIGASAVGVAGTGAGIAAFVTGGTMKKQMDDLNEGHVQNQTQLLSVITKMHQWIKEDLPLQAQEQHNQVVSGYIENYENFINFIKEEFAKFEDELVDTLDKEYKKLASKWENEAGIKFEEQRRNIENTLRDQYTKLWKENEDKLVNEKNQAIKDLESKYSEAWQKQIEKIKNQAIEKFNSINQKWIDQANENYQSQLRKFENDFNTFIDNSTSQIKDAFIKFEEHLNYKHEEELANINNQFGETLTQFGKDLKQYWEKYKVELKQNAESQFNEKLEEQKKQFDTEAKNKVSKLIQAKEQELKKQFEQEKQKIYQRAEQEYNSKKDEIIEDARQLYGQNLNDIKRELEIHFEKWIYEKQDIFIKGITEGFNQFVGNASDFLKKYLETIIKEWQKYEELQVQHFEDAYKQKVEELNQKHKQETEEKINTLKSSAETEFNKKIEEYGNELEELFKTYKTQLDQEAERQYNIALENEKDKLTQQHQAEYETALEKNQIYLKSEYDKKVEELNSEKEEAIKKLKENFKTFLWFVSNWTNSQFNLWQEKQLIKHTEELKNKEKELKDQFSEELKKYGQLLTEYLTNGFNKDRQELQKQFNEWYSKENERIEKEHKSDLNSLYNYLNTEANNKFNEKISEYKSQLDSLFSKYKNQLKNEAEKQYNQSLKEEKEKLTSQHDKQAKEWFEEYKKNEEQKLKNFINKVVEFAKKLWEKIKPVLSQIIEQIKKELEWVYSSNSYLKDKIQELIKDIKDLSNYAVEQFNKTLKFLKSEYEKIIFQLNSFSGEENLKHFDLTKVEHDNKKTGFKVGNSLTISTNFDNSNKKENETYKYYWFLSYPNYANNSRNKNIASPISGETIFFGITNTSTINLEKVRKVADGAIVTCVRLSTNDFYQQLKEVKDGKLDGQYWQTELYLSNEFEVTNPTISTDVGSGIKKTIDSTGTTTYLWSKNANSSSVTIKANCNVDAEYKKFIRYQWYKMDIKKSKQSSWMPIENQKSETLKLNTSEATGKYKCEIWLDDSSLKLERDIDFSEFESKKVTTETFKVNVVDSLDFDPNFGNIDVKIEGKTHTNISSINADDNVTIQPNILLGGKEIQSLKKEGNFTSKIKSTKYLWRRESSEKTNGFYQNQETGEIIFRNIKKEDSGSYICKVILEFENGGIVSYETDPLNISVGEEGKINLVLPNQVQNVPRGMGTTLNVKASIPGYDNYENQKIEYNWYVVDSLDDNNFDQDSFEHLDAIWNHSWLYLSPFEYYKLVKSKKKIVVSAKYIGTITSRIKKDPVYKVFDLNMINPEGNVQVSSIGGDQLELGDAISIMSMVDITNENDINCWKKKYQWFKREKGNKQEDKWELIPRENEWLLTVNINNSLDANYEYKCEVTIDDGLNLQKDEQIKFVSEKHELSLKKIDSSNITSKNINDFISNVKDYDDNNDTIDSSYLITAIKNSFTLTDEEIEKISIRQVQTSFFNGEVQKQTLCIELKNGAWSSSLNTNRSTNDFTTQITNSNKTLEITGDWGFSKILVNDGEVNTNSIINLLNNTKRKETIVDLLSDKNNKILETIFNDNNYRREYIKNMSIQLVNPLVLQEPLTDELIEHDLLIDLSIELNDGFVFNSSTENELYKTNKNNTFTKRFIYKFVNIETMFTNENVINQAVEKLFARFDMSKIHTNYKDNNTIKFETDNQNENIINITTKINDPNRSNSILNDSSEIDNVSPQVYTYRSEIDFSTNVSFNNETMKEFINKIKNKIIQQIKTKDYWESIKNDGNHTDWKYKHPNFTNLEKPIDLIWSDDENKFILEMKSRILSTSLYDILNVIRDIKRFSYETLKSDKNKTLLFQSINLFGGMIQKKSVGFWQENNILYFGYPSSWCIGFNLQSDYVKLQLKDWKSKNYYLMSNDFWLAIRLSSELLGIDYNVENGTPTLTLKNVYGNKTIDSPSVINSNGEESYNFSKNNITTQNVNNLIQYVEHSGGIKKEYLKTIFKNSSQTIYQLVDNGFKYNLVKQLNLKNKGDIAEIYLKKDSSSDNLKMIFIPKIGSAFFNIEEGIDSEFTYRNFKFGDLTKEIQTWNNSLKDSFDYRMSNNVSQVHVNGKIDPDYQGIDILSETVKIYQYLEILYNFKIV